MNKELLQQALDALTTRDVRLHESAAEAIRAELAKPAQPPAQPAQEPISNDFLEILEAVRRELDNGDKSGNAPGHAHDVPGIWDSDNGKKAGKPCAWCAAWKTFTGLIDAEKASGIGGKA